MPSSILGEPAGDPHNMKSCARTRVYPAIHETGRTSFGAATPSRRGIAASPVPIESGAATKARPLSDNRSQQFHLSHGPT
jgi:hypothetical protein